jgi:hypothetical protein
MAGAIFELDFPIWGTSTCTQNILEFQVHEVGGLATKTKLFYNGSQSMKMFRIALSRSLPL